MCKQFLKSVIYIMEFSSCGRGLPPDCYSASHNHKAGRFSCIKCGKKFKKLCLLHRHEVVHSFEKPFECPECLKRFSQKSSLQRHCSEQHNPNNKRYKCAKCPLSFTQNSNLRLHEEKVHPSKIVGCASSSNHACDRCACIYRRKQELSRHINEIHSGGVLSEKEIDVGDANMGMEDEIALAQRVLEQLKSLQSELPTVEAQTVPQTKTEENVSCATGARTEVDEAFISEVHLSDRLNTQGTEYILRAQRIARADGFAYYICEFCAKEFRKSYDFIRHRRVHTQQRPYKCAFCERAFSTKSKLHDHVIVHRLDERTGILAKQYACPFCSQTFSSLRRLDKHKRTHPGNYSANYVCNTCNATFTSIIAFSSHKHNRLDELEKLQQATKPINVCSWKTAISFDLEMYSKTSKPLRKWKCATCGRLFSSSSALVTHQRIYHGVFKHTQQESSVGMRCFKCEHCRRFFRNQSHCNAHAKTHLLNVKPPCEIQVEKGKSTPNALEGRITNNEAASNAATKVSITNVHYDYIGVNEPATKKISPASIHTCHICTNKFGKLCDLKRHLVTHTGERSHECPTCHKGFGLISTLKQHQLTHLSERRKHVCIVCGKMYSAKKALNVHLSIHTGQKSFICEYCNRAFRTSGQRIAHLKVAHGQGRGGSKNQL